MLRITIISLLLLIALDAAAYDLPETLRYRLSWIGIPIGSSTLETREGEQCLRIVSTVESAAWTAPFYRVADRETSCLLPTADGLEQGSYRKELREGPLKVHRFVDLDRRRGMILHRNLLTEEKSAAPFDGEVWDPVAGMLALRRLPLQVGDAVTLHLIDNDRPNPVEVRVLRRETVATAAGTFPALVLRSESSLDTEGLFYAPGELTVWLSDDAGRVPLAIEKRVRGLFAQGIPLWLRPLIPESMMHSPRLETIRAELVERP